LGNQEVWHAEDSQNKLRVPPVATGRCGRSSSVDDDGKKQGKKAVLLTEFQKVHNFRGSHVMHCN
jgi:hypothetical protein